MRKLLFIIFVCPQALDNFSIPFYTLTLYNIDYKKLCLVPVSVSIVKNVQVELYSTAILLKL